MNGDSIRVMLLVTDVFDDLGVAYAVGGSLSSSVHGVMRSTLDIDIIADLQLAHIRPLVAALSPIFYADDEMMREAIARHGSFNLIHYETAFKVDIFIPKERDFDRQQLERRIASVVTEDPQRSVYVTSPEDIILSKLEWYRMGDEVSDRQWRDILGVIKMKFDRLDLVYLHRLAAELGIEELLERAVKQACA